LILWNLKTHLYHFFLVKATLRINFIFDLENVSFSSFWSTSAWTYWMSYLWNICQLYKWIHKVGLQHLFRGCELSKKLPFIIDHDLQLVRDRSLHFIIWDVLYRKHFNDHAKINWAHWLRDFIRKYSQNQSDTTSVYGM
jgi:hypothetical protein